MRIELTKSTAEEIINVLRSFPDGELLSEGKIIFWETSDDPRMYKPSQIVPARPVQTNQPVAQQSKGKDPIKGMRDYLFESFA